MYLYDERIDLLLRGKLVIYEEEENKPGSNILE